MIHPKNNSNLSCVKHLSKIYDIEIINKPEQSRNVLIKTIQNLTGIHKNNICKNFIYSPLNFGVFKGTPLTYLLPPNQV